jgi:hypothetical protein
VFSCIVYQTQLNKLFAFYVAEHSLLIFILNKFNYDCAALRFKPFMRKTIPETISKAIFLIEKLFRGEVFQFFNKTTEQIHCNRNLVNSRQTIHVLTEVTQRFKALVKHSPQN